MKSTPVDCEGRTYKIHVGLGILPRSGRILKDLNLSKRLVVISNRQVLKLYGTTLDRSLSAAGFEVSTINLPDGERTKSLATVEKIYHRLLQLRLDRWRKDAELVWPDGPEAYCHRSSVDGALRR